MSAIGQDLALQLIFQIAPRGACRRRRNRQRQSGEGQCYAGAQAFLAIIHGGSDGAQVTHLHGERAHELAIGGEFRARQNEIGMLQPGDDALGGDFRRPGKTADALAEHAHPVIDERARIGGRQFAVGAFQMAQPAETLKCRFPLRRRRLDGERRQPAGLDQSTGECAGRAGRSGYGPG